MDNLPDLQARSPWAALGDIREVEVIPADKPLDIEVRVPGSKSFTNRALVIAGLANGTSRISGLLRSDDSFWCIDSLRKLGVRVTVDGDVAEIHGAGGSWPNLSADLYLGASGTNSRFIPGALTVAKKGQWTVDGSRRMRERPLAPLVDSLGALGADIEYLQTEGFLPIKVSARGLRGGKTTISGKVSSQFISGLLICAPYAESPVDIIVEDQIVQHAYVHITLDMMRQFGAQVEADEGLTHLRIAPVPYEGRELPLEADASTAGYFLALAAATGGRVKIANLGVSTRQPDALLVNVLEQMGCSVSRSEKTLEVRGASVLRGGFTISMREMSDQTLTLACLAPLADGPITITDVGHIRHHESDRIAAICQELGKLGVRVEEHEDGLTIHPGYGVGSLVDSHDDHRVAMSLAVLGAVVPGVRIADPGCVSKTCPTFFEILEQVGVHSRMMQS